MQEVFDYLKALEVNFLATRTKNGVSCRPFGDPVKFDEKIYMLTLAYKEVAKQLANDNHICIVAYNPEKGNWLRIFCEAVDDSGNTTVKQAIIDEFDWATEAGYTLDIRSITRTSSAITLQTQKRRFATVMKRF